MISSVEPWAARMHQACLTLNEQGVKIGWNVIPYV